MPRLRDNQLSLLPDRPLQGTYTRVPLGRLDYPIMGVDAEFVSNIASFGVLQPIIVTTYIGPDGITYYKVHAGRRRANAASAAQLGSVPVFVVDNTTDAIQRAVSLSENAHRSANPLTDWANIQQLIEQGFGVEQIARQLGMTPSTVRGRLSLGNLSPALRNRMEAGLLSIHLANRIARWPLEDQHRLLRRVPRGERITAAHIRTMARGDQATNAQSATQPDVASGIAWNMVAESGGNTFINPPPESPLAQYSEETIEMFQPDPSQEVRVDWAAGAMPEDAGQGVSVDGATYEIIRYRDERWVPAWVVERGAGMPQYDGWIGVQTLLAIIEDIMPVEPNDDTDAFFIFLSGMRARVGRRMASQT